jgi:Helix-loop-helix DNA-binding domain
LKYLINFNFIVYDIQVLRPLRGAGKVLVVESRKKKRRGGIVGRSRGGGCPPIPNSNQAEHSRRANKGAKERDRRAELGSSFEALRLQVPTLRAQGPSATKQVILREAVQHIKVLEEQSHTYHKVRLLLKRQHQRMIERVGHLGNEEPEADQ